MRDHAHAADPIAKAVATAARRVRFQRALDGGVIFAVAGAAVAGLGVCLLKTGAAEDARRMWLAAGALPLLGVALGALRPMPALLAARLCDRAAGGVDLLSSAWSFRQRAGKTQTPFMRACIRQAEARACDIRGPAVFPLHWPKGLVELACVAAGAAALGLVEVPVAVPERTPLASATPAALLHEEELAAFRDELRALGAETALPQPTQEAVAEINALLEAIASGELDREAALRELRRLMRELEGSGKLGPREAESAVDDALRELGRSLSAGKERAQLIESVAEAMKGADAQRARDALSGLARKVSEEVPASSRGGLERALRRGAKTPADRLQEEVERARRELDRLLKKKKKNDQAQTHGQRDRRLLKKKERKLDQLERKHQTRQAARRELDRLRRELDAAADGLARGSDSESSRHLERAAEELSRIAQQRRTQAQRQGLRRKLAQLREQLSKQRGRARRQDEDRAAKPGRGQRGEGQALTVERFGRLAKGRRGQPGSGDQGQQAGRDSPAQGLLLPGENGADGRLLLEAPESDATLGLSEEALTRSSRAGKGGRPESAAEPTKLEARHTDTRVQGDKGAGPTRSEIIQDASSHGFASRPYERVHAQYEQHAESVLDRDQVPGGYRFYVRRYFQLIRPREETP